MIQAKITGLPDLKAQLRAIPEKLRKRALRTALAAGARVVRNEAQRLAPVIKSSDAAVKKGYRKPGTLRKAIAVRTSKIARRSGDVGVFVNVRPAKGAVFRNGAVVRKKERGAKSPNDPFYWRFLEFGRTARGLTAERSRVQRNKKRGIKGVRFRRALRAVGAIAGVKFLTKSAGKLREALDVFNAKMIPAIQKLNNKGQTP